MPELPEVEVVKRSLESKIQNKIIKKVKINDIKLRYKLNIKKISQLNNLKIKKIERRSKYLLFHFDKPIMMLVHLGMTGKFFFINENKKKFFVEEGTVEFSKNNLTILSSNIIDLDSLSKNAISSMIEDSKKELNQENLSLVLNT